MFQERDLVVPYYVVHEEMRKAMYHDILKDETREFLSMSKYRTLEDMIAWAREQEINLGTVRKRKSV